MLSPRSVWQRSFRPILTVLWELLRDGLQFLNVAARSQTAVTAEVLFLRKQLAYYQDHQIRPRRLTDAARLSLVLWSQLFEWKEALIVVTPRTFVCWHRKAFNRVIANLEKGQLGEQALTLGSRCRAGFDSPPDTTRFR